MTTSHNYELLGPETNPTELHMRGICWCSCHCTSIDLRFTHTLTLYFKPEQKHKKYSQIDIVL